MAPTTRAMSKRAATGSPKTPTRGIPSRKKQRKMNLSEALETAIASPQPKLTPLEESNAKYTSYLVAKEEEKQLKALPKCAICMSEFASTKTCLNPLHAYFCPNERCTVRFCQSCRSKQLKYDDRCPFCRLPIVSGSDTPRRLSWIWFWTWDHPEPLTCALLQYRREEFEGIRQLNDRMAVRVEARPSHGSRPQHRYTREHRRIERVARAFVSEVERG